jgi:hypothetical protein
MMIIIYEFNIIICEFLNIINFINIICFINTRLRPFKVFLLLYLTTKSLYKFILILNNVPFINNIFLYLEIK